MLIERMQEFYRESPDMQRLMAALERGIDRMDDAQEEMLAGIFITPDISPYMLEKWEKALGLDVWPDKPGADRRALILSRIRGQGTATVKMIQNMAESFSGGEAEIMEHPAESRIEVVFTGTIGAPPNMEDFKNALEEVIPAHLAYALVFIYIQHLELAGRTHGALGEYTHGQIRNGGITDGNNGEIGA